MPTANMEVLDESILPPAGVYVTEILLDGRVHYGITNIGTSPTVDNDKEISVETHILNFNEEIYANIDLMFSYVEKSVESMLKVLNDIENVEERDIIASYNREREINNLRNQLRTTNVENINDRHYEYQSGIYYMDIISTLEKAGDYIINVTDTIRDEFRHR